ncbi:MAG TPA: ATP-binding protein [Anaerolineales bacterium]|nr:ATP-binding protein [Anaerolineales bacterium]
MPRRTRSLKTKLSIFQFLSGLTGIILIFIVAWLGSQQRLLSNANIEAENLSDQIAYSISILATQNGDETFNYQRLIEKSATLNNIRSIKVINKDGIVIADNVRKNIGHRLDSPMITAALQNQSQEKLLEGKTLIVVRPLHGESFTATLSDITGALWIEMDLAPAYTRNQKDILMVLWVGLGGFLLVFYLYFQVTQTGIIDRMAEISKGLVIVEKGDLTQRIKVSNFFGSEDEVNELVHQFNQMISSLSRKLSFEELTSNLSAKFMNIPASEMSAAVKDTLMKMGEIFEVDRTYIFEFSEDHTLIKNTFEWCAENINPQIDNLQNIHISIIPWWMSLLNKSESIIIERVSEMPPEAASEKRILEEQNIKSVLVMPMISDSGLFGFIGFDSVSKERAWTSEEINLVSVLNGIITNTLIRQYSQKELIEERDFALQVMNTVGQGLTVTNEHGEFEYVNPAYAQMLNHPLESLIGRPPSDFTHPNDRQNQFDEFQKRKSGHSSVYYSRLMDSNGSVVNVLVSATPRMRNGTVAGSIASITNLTEQLVAEEKLRQSESRNRAFLNAIPDLIFRIDQNGNFLDYKAGEAQQLYIPPEEIMGANILNVLPPEVGQKAFVAIKKALATLQPQVFEYKLQTSSGIFTFETRIVATTSEEAVAIVHDITDRARLEQMKTDFINRASHELRTPLTTSLLMVDLLDGNELDPGEVDEYWQILKQELNRERLILEDVLTVGHLEAGKYLISESRISILPSLQISIEAIIPQGKIRDIRIEVDIPKELPHLRGSEEAFVRVFSNVLSNAVKFSKPGGIVYLKVHQDKDSISVIVEDKGIGIPLEDLPHITTRFFRGTNASEQEIPGSGIGLYIIKNIVEEMGGKLSIQSQLNHGTKISLLFPIP